MKLLEVVAPASDDSEPRRLQLVFCRVHAESLMERDEWFGPNDWREAGWFIGVEFEEFDLAGVLAGQTGEAKLMGRAVAHMIGLVP